ncbi:MAG: Lrp/AsnC family transcriptional regulator [Clostridia bacterium]|nr:Lrp/AsnC family transcriptional regulator [Clostridia bacterium]
MKSEIVKLLTENARYTFDQMAKMLGCDAKTVEAEVKALEKEGIIKGYKTIVDIEKCEDAPVSAMVELNVIPKADLGFEEVAQRVAEYPQVESVYLMSGGYDLNVVVKGKSLHDIARFVAKELATIDSVTSTATHFVMRRYKEMDVILCENEGDDREYIL